MFASRQCALFVDESGTAIGRYAKDMGVLATQSRHFGHKSHFITQRASMLDPTIRDQCDTLFVFRVGKRDSDTLAEEFGYSIIKDAHNLEKGHCFKLSRFSAPQKIDVFNRKIVYEKNEKPRIMKTTLPKSEEKELQDE